MADEDLKTRLQIEAEKTLRVGMICICIMGLAALGAMVAGVVYG